MAFFAAAVNRRRDVAAWVPISLCCVLLVLCSPTHASLLPSNWACGKKNLFLLQASALCTDPDTGIKYVAGATVRKPCGSMRCTLQLGLLTWTMSWSCSYNATTVTCRNSAGFCDLPERCTGSSLQCPSNSFKPADTPCRTPDLPCDATEFCTGSSAACPEDRPEPAGTVCRPVEPGSLCDVEEVCDGVSITCPADEFKPFGTVCSPPPTDSCDFQKLCPGTSAVCPTLTEFGPIDAPEIACIGKCGASLSADPACPSACSPNSCAHLNFAGATNNPDCNAATGKCQCTDGAGNGKTCEGVSFEGLGHFEPIPSGYAGLEWINAQSFNATKLCEDAPDLCAGITGAVSPAIVLSQNELVSATFYRTSGTFQLKYLYATAVFESVNIAMVGRVCNSAAEGSPATMGAIDGCVDKYGATFEVVTEEPRFVQLGWTGINRVDYTTVEDVFYYNAIDNLGIELD